MATNQVIIETATKRPFRLFHSICGDASAFISRSLNPAYVYASVMFDNTFEAADNSEKFLYPLN